MAEWGKKITRQELVDLCEQFISLIDEGAFFRDLSYNTKKQYRIAATNILKGFGGIQAHGEITPQVAQSLIDEVASKCGPSAAKAVKSVTGPMWSFMIHYTHIDCLHQNPFSTTIVQEGGHIEAWTEELCEYVISHYKDLSGWQSVYVSTMTMLLLDTAQRLGDAVTMSAEDVATSTTGTRIISITQEKTNQKIMVPVSTRLENRMHRIYRGPHGSTYSGVLEQAAILEGIIQPFTGKFTADTARYLFKKELHRIGVKAPPTHGIRKAAINRMIKAGATEFEIMGLTGHKQSSTVSMYARDFDRSNAAARAMEKVSNAQGK